MVGRLRIHTGSAPTLYWDGKGSGPRAESGGNAAAATEPVKQWGDASCLLH